MLAAAGSNHNIVKRVVAGAELFSVLVNSKLVAILADVGQLGVVLLGWVQDNIRFGLDLLKAVTKLRATFADNLARL